MPGPSDPSVTVGEDSVCAAVEDRMSSVEGPAPFIIFFIIFFLTLFNNKRPKIER